MRGAELRVRPVVMTSLTAALGLLPAALANSIGSQAQKPLAIVVVGGMLVTLFLTRYLMPVLYSFFPAPAGHGECETELIDGLALHRPVPRSRSRADPSRPITRTADESTTSDADHHRTTVILEDPSHEDRLETRLVLLAVIAGIGGLAGAGPPDPGPRRGRSGNSSPARRAHAEETRPSKAWIPTSLPTKAPWDHGSLTLDADQIKAIGLQDGRRQAADRADASLRLTGVTDYDPATLTVVRSQFDCRVDKVLVDLGSVVKKGDPLLEVFSTDLAEAKSNYETAISQWTRDKKVLDYKTPWPRANAIPRKELIEVENDEAKSRLKMKLAKDKLLVYGLTEKEIEDAKKEDGVQKARMILRSRADGIVIKRTVVQGNYYDSKDDLMQIAPLDHLWVRGNVSELDADKVEVGQKLKVIFPYSDRTIDDKVEYIDKAIDPETAVRQVPASIPNPEKRSRPACSCGCCSRFRRKPGRTVIPRGAMVSVDRFDYRLRQATGHERPVRAPAHLRGQGDQRLVVIVAEPSPEHPGLKPGEEVVTTGSLILEQMYEDRLMVEGEFLVDADDDEASASREDRSRPRPPRRVDLASSREPVRFSSRSSTRLQNSADADSSMSGLRCGRQRDCIGLVPSRWHRTDGRDRPSSVDRARKAADAMMDH